MVDTSISIELCCIHYVQLLYQEMILFHHMRVKGLGGFIPSIQFIHPWQGQCRDFSSNYLSRLVPILWPEWVWFLNNYTPRWASISVMDLIQRYFELSASFSFLGTSLDRWSLMCLVIIMGHPLSLWWCQYLTHNTGWMTFPIPRCPLFSHSPVSSKNNSSFVLINPQLKKDLFGVFAVWENN